jgi:ribosomal-protein-alanine N-acetyltransferase
MIIQKLSVDAVDQIISLYGSDFADDWNKNMLLSSFNGGRFLCYGAFSDGALVGAITLTVGLDDADIESVFTLKSARRKGVADALIERAIDELKNLGKKGVLLEVREGNTPAKNLYFKHGFKQISVRKKYYQDGENAVILAKEI